MASPMDKLTVLVIGNGGREHALVWKLSQSPLVDRIIVVPGNGGMAMPKVEVETSVAADDFAGLVALAKREGVNLAVPGPEAPLVDGVEAFFREAGIHCFGPSREASRLEGSKTFSKDFMREYRIPTAAYENFSDYEEALEYVRGVEHDVVIKATGLAAGKGVIIPASKDEACDALRKIMVDKAFGAAGEEVVVEEFLQGDELSILTFCDGYSIRSFPPAQDHKRIFDGDLGENTGGMGCYAPTNIVTKDLLRQIDSEILEPTIAGMRDRRAPFRGVLFTGLMITKDGPKVLEYNVRFGDPEVQTVLPLLAADCDLADVMLACCRGYLDKVELRVEPLFSATVVAASGGYPGSYRKGVPMHIKAVPEGVNLFHAGTKLTGDGLETSGGRVIAVNATAGTLEDAVKLAYTGMESVAFEGIQFRRDIAHRAFKRQNRPEALTYAQAGVSIESGNEFVEKIKHLTAATARTGADGKIGGFGGEFHLSECGFPDAPTLVGAIDGVGTKLMVAEKMGKHDTVGVDLVAMNVNDLVVQGAEPIMFLDYFGCSKLDQRIAVDFVKGVSDGCRQAGCALVGGETAEMPGIYQGKDYDAAGAAVGFVTSSQRLPRLDEMREGDVLLGLPSSGVHSNGFTLVRKVVEMSGLSYQDPSPWDTSLPLGEALLAPTTIYVRPLLSLCRHGLAKGMAHITGGGLVDNVPRMLPERLAAEIDMAALGPKVLPVFKWLKRTGGVAALEMCRTFNNGVGMVVAVGAGDEADRAEAVLAEAGCAAFRIGRLVARQEGEDGCSLVGLDDSLWER